jgi:hypothetical protein
LVILLLFLGFKKGCCDHDLTYKALSNSAKENNPDKPSGVLAKEITTKRKMRDLGLNWFGPRK